MKYFSLLLLLASGCTSIPKETKATEAAPSPIVPKEIESLFIHDYMLLLAPISIAITWLIFTHMREKDGNNV